MNDLTIFYQKNGLTVRNIARDLLCLNEGETLTSIAEYTEIFGMSRWTIQTAIQYLLENKCMNVEKHGPNGTQVYDINHKKLWEIADFDPFVCMAPPPDTVTYQGLYTGLAQSIRTDDMPFILGYMVPAGIRLEALFSGRCHFIIVSRLSAKILMEKYDNLIMATEIKGGKYSSSLRIFARDGAKPVIKDGVVVGLPQDSVDVIYVTERLCKDKKVIYKRDNYHGCANMLQNGEIDILIQKQDINERYGKHYASADIPDIGLKEDIVTPVLLCDSNDYGVESVIRHYIDPGNIARVQKEVLEGKQLFNFY